MFIIAIYLLELAFKSDLGHLPIPFKAALKSKATCPLPSYVTNENCPNLHRICQQLTKNSNYLLVVRHLFK